MTILPEDAGGSKMAANMPKMKVKAEMQPSNLKIVGKAGGGYNRV